MGHLGVVLYEYLGEEYPEVLGSILGALKVSVFTHSYLSTVGFVGVSIGTGVSLAFCFSESFVVKSVVFIMQ